MIDFSDKGTGAQGRQVTCLRLHSERLAWAPRSFAHPLPTAVRHFAFSLPLLLIPLLWGKILAKTLAFLIGTSP